MGRLIIYLTAGSGQAEYFSFAEVRQLVARQFYSF